MSKNNEKYFEKVLEEIEIIEKYKTLYFPAIGLIKQSILDGIVLRMIQMSEYLDSIDETFKNMHQDIEWRNIKGFRNRLVHDYGGVDLEFLENAIKKDIPKLKKQLLNCIGKFDDENNK